MRSPLRVLMSRSPVMIPPSVTSGASARSARVPVVAVAHCASSARKRSKGWPVMKKPRDSFSWASRSPSPQEGVSGIPAPPVSASPGGPPLPERAGRAVLVTPLPFRARPGGRVDGGEKGGPPVVQRVEGAALDEALDHAPVHGPQVHTLTEIKERAKRAVRAGAEHRFHRSLPHV